MGSGIIKNWFFNHRKLLISKLWQIARKVDKYYADNNFLDTNKLKTVM